MKKKFAALFMAITVVASGAAGFGGTCLANHLASPQATVQAAPFFQGAGVSLGEDIAIFTAASSSSGSGSSSDSSSSGSSSGKKTLTIPEIASKASNSVVEIYTESVVRGIFLRQYVVEGSGSGVIIKSDGHIVTSNHVIDGARKITVRMKDGTEYPATIIGQDSNNDLAVVKVDAKGLSAATYGDSGKLAVGELAVAIGNPLGKLGGSVTEGIISALGRNIEINGQTLNLLQTSAAINPGNSGGGLFNSSGELIGVVNSKSGGTYVEGIGFAIPSNKVKSVVNALME